jgi:uncharacterized protein (TIGR03066 family)
MEFAMRTLLAMGLMLVLTCAVTAADDKIDATKLLGKWEPKDPDKGGKFVIEFLKDGKISFAAGEGGKDFKAEGTYKVDGNKISLAIKFGDMEKKMTRTVSKLTDTELVSKDDEKKDDKDDTLIRIKEKK